MAYNPALFPGSAGIPARKRASSTLHVSTVSVESAAERGMNAVRKLDAIVRNMFRDDAATLAAWESARHVESPARPRRRPNGSAGDTNTGG